MGACESICHAPRDERQRQIICVGLHGDKASCHTMHIKNLVIVDGAFQRGNATAYDTTLLCLANSN